MNNAALRKDLNAHNTIMPDLNGSGTAPAPGAGPYIEYAKSRQAANQGSILASSHAAEPFVCEGGWLVADPAMRRIKEIADQIAAVNLPVLITGEAGSGKETIARYIHARSAFASGPFVAVNCSAIPAASFESELFGYQKGAFTGASTDRVGLLESANNGTMLLDEVTNIDGSSQSKLLRVIEERRVRRLGGNSDVALNGRIIATTTVDPMAMVASGAFRQDLYTRLYVLHIEVPALRQRPADVDALARHFAEKECIAAGRKPVNISDDARKALRAYSWPGNVRELRSVIKRAVGVCAGETILAGDLGFEGVGSRAESSAKAWIDALPVGSTLQEVETQFILRTLEHHQGNRTHAAKTLGISLRTLRNKINEFSAEGIDVIAPLTGRAS
jgi:DNA-binding NtrC family response regulator